MKKEYIYLRNLRCIYIAYTYMNEISEKSLWMLCTDTLTMQITIFSMQETQYQILHDSIANGAQDEILGQPCVLSDSLFLSIFYKKGAALYSTRRTKIMGIGAESRRLLIDRSSLIFCQIGRITVRRLNELPWWLSLTSLHGSPKVSLFPFLNAKITIGFNF